MLWPNCINTLVGSSLIETATDQKNQSSIQANVRTSRLNISSQLSETIIMLQFRVFPEIITAKPQLDLWKLG